VRQTATVVSVQNQFNLADRSAEPVLGYCASQGIAFIPYRPLAAGAPAAARNSLAELAIKHDATPAQLALAWLLKRSPVMLPIPGTSSVRHLEDNMRGAAISLTAGEFDELSAIA
jgi:pyridoxine 4-dehydrogenase